MEGKSTYESTEDNINIHSPEEKKKDIFDNIIKNSTSYFY